jgi:hypothetical protein
MLIFTVLVVRSFGTTSSDARSSAEDGLECRRAMTTPATTVAASATDPTTIHHQRPPRVREVAGAVSAEIGGTGTGSTGVGCMSGSAGVRMTARF